MNFYWRCAKFLLFLLSLDLALLFVISPASTPDVDQSPLKPDLHPPHFTTQTNLHYFAMMDSQNQNTSLQRLQHDEKRIVRVMELAGGVMEELANPSGPRKELVNNNCSEFMQLIKDIQVTLREEIKSACEYRPFEKCDYVPRIANELCCKKLEHMTAKIDEMKKAIE